MATVAYDHQAFTLQKFGGVSRYFTEIATCVPQQSALRTHVVAPLHLNQHLASAKVAKSALYQPLRFRGSDRLNQLAARLASPLLLRMLRPDIVHWTWYDRSQEVPPGSRKVVTVFDMIHELFPDLVAPGDNSGHFKRQSVAAADHVICISESTKRDLQRLCDVPDSKVTVTHLAASPIFTTTDASAELPTSGRPYLLYVGNRGGYKGFDRTLRAFAASPRLPRDFDLVAFGGPSFSGGERDFICSLGLAPTLVRHVNGDDAVLAEKYRQARALVYPSQYEGFGIPPLEAMGCGCPVACADTSSIPEVVADAALMFDPQEVDSIRYALESLCYDEVARQHYVLAGKRRAQHFSWSRCARETASVYQSLLDA
jgi:glycosyltransferase involved in cell wall biosynthesis